jgi:hypothetical protein
MAGVSLGPGQYYLGGGNDSAGGIANAWQAGMKAADDILTSSQNREIGAYTEARARGAERRTMELHPLMMEKERANIANIGAQTGMYGAQTGYYGAQTEGARGQERRAEAKHPFDIEATKASAQANLAAAAQGFAAANESRTLLAPRREQIQAQTGLTNAQITEAEARSRLTNQQAISAGAMLAGQLQLQDAQIANLSSETQVRLAKLPSELNRIDADIRLADSQGQQARAQALRIQGDNLREQAKLATSIDLTRAQIQYYQANAASLADATARESAARYLALLRQRLTEMDGRRQLLEAGREAPPGVDWNAVFRRSGFEPPPYREGGLVLPGAAVRPNGRVDRTVQTMQEGGTLLFGGAAQRPGGRVDMPMPAGEQYVVPPAAEPPSAPVGLVPPGTNWTPPRYVPYTPQYVPASATAMSLEGAPAVGPQAYSSGMFPAALIPPGTPAAEANQRREHIKELAKVWHRMPDAQREQVFAAMAAGPTDPAGQAFALAPQASLDRNAYNAFSEAMRAYNPNVLPTPGSSAPSSVPLGMSTGGPQQLADGTRIYTPAPGAAPSPAEVRERVAARQPAGGQPSQPAGVAPPGSAVAQAAQGATPQAAPQQPAGDTNRAAAMQAYEGVLATRQMQEQAYNDLRLATINADSQAISAASQAMRAADAQYRQFAGTYAAANLRMGNSQPAMDFIRQTYPGATVAQGADNDIFVSIPQPNGQRHRWRGTPEQFAAEFNAAYNPAVRKAVDTETALNVKAREAQIKAASEIAVKTAEIGNQLRADVYLAQLKAQLAPKDLKITQDTANPGRVFVTDPSGNQVGVVEFKTQDVGGTQVMMGVPTFTQIPRNR